MKTKIKAGIIGGAGYTGGEMLRVLLQHPSVDISFVHSRSNAGQPVSSVHEDLYGDTEIRFSDEVDQGCDAVFLCLGHGESRVFMDQNLLPQHTRIIDLSQDFRLAANNRNGERTFIYGLPETNKNKIQAANAIANPGCFATAIQLTLLPLAANGLLGEVHATGITGSTGAGQKLQASSHFSWRANNVEAYKSLTHQHMQEVGETISALQPSEHAINFIPWRGSFTRGIYLSAYTKCTLSLEEAYTLYEAYYTDAPFTFVSKKMVHLKQVVNTNKCLIHLEKEGEKLVLHTAIDNLLKGASGQAVQNMNIMFGLAESEGLNLKASSF